MLEDFLPGRSSFRDKKPDAPYAGMNSRMLAASIDSVLIMLLLAPLTDLFSSHVFQNIDMTQMMLEAGQATTVDQQLALLDKHGVWMPWFQNMLVQTGVLAAATLACWLPWAATPGKMVLGLRIADATTFGRPTRLQYVVRFAGYLLSSLPIFLGFLWIAFDARKQGWHDKLAGTVVVHKRKLAAYQVEVAMEERETAEEGRRF